MASTLAATLAVGMVPAVALAADPAPAQGTPIETLANVTAADLFAQGAVTAVKANDVADAAVVIAADGGTTITASKLVDVDKTAVLKDGVLTVPASVAADDPYIVVPTEVTAAAPAGTTAEKYDNAKYSVAYYTVNDKGAKDKLIGYTASPGYHVADNSSSPLANAFKTDYIVVIEGTDTAISGATVEFKVKFQKEDLSSAVLFNGTDAKKAAESAAPFTYTGAALANLNLALGDKVLDPSKDYTVELYKEGVATKITDLHSGITAIGHYTGTVTGAGVYEGSVDLDFQVIALELDKVKVEFAEASGSPANRTALDGKTGITDVLLDGVAATSAQISAPQLTSYPEGYDGTAATLVGGVYTYTIKPNEDAAGSQSVTGQATATYTVYTGTFDQDTNILYDTTSSGAAWSTASSVTTYAANSSAAFDLSKKQSFDLAKIGVRQDNSSNKDKPLKYGSGDAAKDVPFTVTATEKTTKEEVTLESADTVLGVGEWEVVVAIDPENATDYLYSGEYKYDVEVVKADMSAGKFKAEVTFDAGTGAVPVTSASATTDTTVTYDAAVDWATKLDIKKVTSTDFTLELVAGTDYTVKVYKVADEEGTAIAAAKQLVEDGSMAGAGTYQVRIDAPEYGIDGSQGVAASLVATIQVDQRETKLIRIKGIQGAPTTNYGYLDATGEPIELSFEYYLAGGATSAKSWADLPEGMVTYTVKDGAGKDVDTIQAAGKYTIALALAKDADKNWDLATTTLQAATTDFTATDTSANGFGTVSATMTISVNALAPAWYRLAGLTDGVVVLSGDAAYTPAFEYTTDEVISDATEWTAVPAGALAFTVTDPDGVLVTDGTIAAAGEGYTIAVTAGTDADEVDFSSFPFVTTGTGATYTYKAGATVDNGTKASNIVVNAEAAPEAPTEPTIDFDSTQGTVTWNAETGALTIEPAEGFEVDEVLVNGKAVDAATATAEAGDEVSVTFKEAEPEPNPKADTGNYTDIDNASDWWNANGTHEVQTAIENGWMSGASVGGGKYAFQPSKLMTRGSVAQLIYNIAGQPEVEGYDMPFTDVALVSSYADAVEWCYETGVITGYDDATFRPQNNVTREQFITMLSRYAQATGIDAVGEATALAAYTDAAQVHSYASKTMAWAVEAQLAGVNTSKLNPLGNITRAQGAAMAVRFADKYQA